MPGGSGAGVGQWMGRGGSRPGLYRVHSRPDAKEPGQRVASRVPFVPDRCPGRHGVLVGRVLLKHHVKGAA